MRISDWSSDVCSSDLGATIAEEYALEYGHDRIAMHADACAPGARVLLIDDLIATGGTARAAVRLLRKAGAIATQAQRSEEQTSELQSLMRISYAVFYLPKKRLANAADKLASFNTTT